MLFFFSVAALLRLFQPGSELRAAAAAHCAAALMAHAGQPVAGFALSFLAVTDQDGNREYETEGYG